MRLLGTKQLHKQATFFYMAEEMKKKCYSETFINNQKQKSFAGIG